MIKTRSKANLIRSLGSNEGLAQNLGTFQARFGDWRELFRSADKIDKVTKADIRRIANQTFVPDNRTVGIIEFSPPTSPPATAAAPQGGGQ
jgi:predicted Zn-dependent peptidase